MEEQIVVLVPALAVVGKASTSIETVLVEAGHVPLEIVHIKIFVPGNNPETPEVYTVGVVIVPLPETSDHIPVPTTGEFPDIV